MNATPPEGLTPQDIQQLQAPLPLADHEAREKGTNKDKTKKQYLVYINQEGVIPLLNNIDPNWTWEVQNVHFEPKYVSVTGRLTIKGIVREGVGGNSPNGASSPVDEDTVKGAETDALKRAALRFGVGLYLRGTPTFWIDASLAPWDGAKEALKQFGEWYKREFGNTAKNAPQGTQNGQQHQSTTQPRQNAPASHSGGKTGNSDAPRPITAIGNPQNIIDSVEGVLGHIDDPAPNVYTVRKMKIQPMPNNSHMYVLDFGGTNNITFYGGDKLREAGVDVDAWKQQSGKWKELNPPLKVQADFENGAWVVHAIEKVKAS